MKSRLVASLTVLLVAQGCASHAPSDSGSPTDGSASPDGSAPSDAPSSDTRVGATDAPDGSPLPPLPALTNVVATQREDSVGIDFDPVAGAVDYRVYPLPDPSAVSTHADGSLTVHNAIYRCAGLRQTYDLQNDLNAADPALTTFNHPFNWHAHTLAQPTLGYVYATPGAGRVPVYAAAGYPGQNELGWRESRLKVYTTDDATRATLLAQGFRDDGVVFYVPAAASSATHTIYGSQTATSSSDAAGHPFTLHVQYYFGAGDMAAHAGDTTPPAAAFQVLTAATPDTQPLMGVLYENNHVELAVGTERYQRALAQGNGPLWHLEWAGLTQPTTLVVEALATGCPFQGMLAAQHLTAGMHQTQYTLAELQAASPTGEVFVNGQYDSATAAPVPLARSYINVAPQPETASDWDWYQGFGAGSEFGPVTAMTACTWTGCSGQTPAFDFAAYELDQPMDLAAVFTFGVFQGQLWEAFDDTGQDVTGRVRFTARTMGSVDAERYLHVRMSVNIVSTDRRYPQMIVSDQPNPIDCFTADCNGLGNATSNTLLLQPIQGPASRLEVQAIHGLVAGRQWNVNNQAHEHRLIDGNPNYALSQAAFAALNTATDDTFEHAGVDRMTRFDAYVSSQRMYVYMDGAPAGCTQYPAGFSLGGPVTVTFGDVLYHEGANDELVCSQPRPYGFLHRHQCQETSRHFDDLGFRSGASLPAWDETRFPCNPY